MDKAWTVQTIKGTAGGLNRYATVYLNVRGSADTVEEVREKVEKALNTHDALVNALEELVAVPNKHRPDRVWEEARKALALATGEDHDTP
jgi:hypothetical protein